MNSNRKLGYVLAAAAVCMPGWFAQASVIDLTTAGAIDDTTVAGAVLMQVDPQSTGTGFADAFVQVGQERGNPDVTRGYNTTENGVLNNGSSDQHNHAIQLSEVAIVMYEGVAYREFLLDVNENRGGNHEFISLFDVQIFLSDTPNQSVETFDGSGYGADMGLVELAGTAVWGLDDLNDDSIDNVVELNYELNHGSGSGDMILLVADSLFTGPDSQYVYLYSAFGDPNPQDAGFEEWFVREGEAIVPEPATFGLLLMGLAGAAMRKRKQVS